MTMEQYLFYSLLSGFAVMIAVHIVLLFFKRIDPDSGLPETTSIIFLILGFVSGVAAVNISQEPISILIYDIFFSYTLVMAYTDFYTKQLYTFASIIVFMIGIVLLFMKNYICFSILAYTVFLLLMLLIKMFATGDFLLLIAGMPYLVLFEAQNGYMPGYILALHFLLSMIILVCVHGWKLLKKGRKKIMAAYAPVNYTAAIIITVMGRIFDPEKILYIITG